MILIQRSTAKSIERIRETGIVPQHSTPVVKISLAVSALGVAVALLVAVIWLFVHDPEIALATHKISIPAVCKTADCFPQQPKPRIKTPPAIINAPSCPGGICPTAPNFGSQTVNNGPPPITLTWTVVDVVPPQLTKEKKTFNYEKQIRVAVNENYTPVSIGFQCDADIQADEAYMEGPWMETLENFGTDRDNKKLGFVYLEGTAATPDRPVWIAVWANQPFSVLRVAQTKINNRSH
jgi:hypothetical protein